jgi:hypothetical protein
VAPSGYGSKPDAMIKFYPFALLLLLTSISQAQRVDLGDLLSFTSYNVSKFDALMGKKSYVRDYDSPHETHSNYNYVEARKAKKKKPVDSVVHKLSFLERPTSPVVSYQTTSLAEFNQLRGELKKHGFYTCSKEEDASKPVLYQQLNLSVAASVEIRDTVTYYTLKVEKDVMPKMRELEFAEDLLKLRSHELLATAFGTNNVIKTVFHYTESDSNFCTVLFPNTPREVIFIWEDEVNYREVSFLIVGGHLLTDGTANNSDQIMSNQWRSKQGVYAGMKIEELQAVNEGKLNFYGWKSEQPGYLTKGNQAGKLDFNHLGIVLSCLNCVNNPDMEKYTVDSEKAVQEERKMYVSSIIVIPEREKKQVTAAR